MLDLVSETTSKLAESKPRDHIDLQSLIWVLGAYPPAKADPRNESEVIIEVGADGGSVTLYGIRTQRGWFFSREVINSGLMLIDEGPTIQHKSAVVDSWEAALQLLDQYPWATLYPISIHPDFSGKIVVAMQERLRNNTETPRIDAI